MRIEQGTSIENMIQIASIRDSGGRAAVWRDPWLDLYSAYEGFWTNAVEESNPGGENNEEEL